MQQHHNPPKCLPPKKKNQNKKNLAHSKKFLPYFHQNHLIMFSKRVHVLIAKTTSIATHFDKLPMLYSRPQLATIANKIFQLFSYDPSSKSVFDNIDCPHCTIRFQHVHCWPFLFPSLYTNIVILYFCSGLLLEAIFSF